MTCSKTTPSPAVSDSPPMSSRFMKNLPRSACEPLIIGPRPTKASMDISSRPSPRPDTCVKPLEQPNKAVLRTELPKGSSRMGVKPSSRINSAPSSPIRMNFHAVAKIPATERKEVHINERRDLSAVGHLPLRNAAITPRKLMPVSPTRGPPAQTSEVGINPSFHVNSTRQKPNTVSTCQVTDGTTHLKTAARSSASDIATHLRVGETPSAGVLEHSEKRSVVARPAIKQPLTSSSKVEEI